jgi:hypothetical protein
MVVGFSSSTIRIFLFIFFKFKSIIFKLKRNFYNNLCSNFI